MSTTTTTSKVCSIENADYLVKLATSTGEDLLKIVESQSNALTKLQSEHDALSKKVDEDKIILQKVASAQPLLETFTDGIVSLGIIPEEKRQSYLEGMQNDFSLLVKVANKVIEFSKAPVSQGRGINKSAAANDTSKGPSEAYTALVADGWMNCADGN